MQLSKGFPGGTVVKIPPANTRDKRSLGLADSLEKEMATHSSILAWEIPQTQKPGGLQTHGVAKSQTRLRTCACAHTCVRTQLNSAAAAKLLQSCPTLCNPIDGSPLGSSVSGSLQARILEWGATAFSNAWKWKEKVKLLSRANSSRPHGLQPTRLLRPWDFPGKRTGVGCHCN